MTTKTVQYGLGVGRMFHAYEVESHGTYWELQELVEGQEIDTYVGTYDTVAQVLEVVNAAGGQVLLQSQEWYNANMDELLA